MRYLPLFIIVVLLDIYTFQAFSTAFGNGLLWSYLGQFIYWAIPVVTILYVHSLSNGFLQKMSRNFNTVIRSILIILYLSKVFTASWLLIDDIRRALFGLINLLNPELLFDTSRSVGMSQIALLLGAIPLISLTYGMIRNPYRYRIHRHSVPISNLHPDLDQLKIVQISDIHAGSFMKVEPVRKSVRMINDLSPDIVFFTGDLVNSTAEEVDPFLDVFGRIEARYGVYSILGNHDYGDYVRWPDLNSKKLNFDRLCAAHEKMGWTLLKNQHKQLKIKSASLGLIGVENYSASARFAKYGDMKVAIDGMQASDALILLSHDPSHWDHEIIKAYPEIDLTLAGHTHGFQFGIDIPGLLKWSPVQYFYKQWAGLYKKGDQYLYVNRGLGFLGYPGRVGVLPEITLLTLEHKSS